MAQTKIYLELSDEFQQLLADNRISIEYILQNENIDAEVTYGIMPYPAEEEARTKELVTIILAASGAVVAISFAISKVLNMLYNKPHIVEISENKELRDKNGNILLDEEGKPLFKPVKRYELIEPRREERKDEFEFGFGLKNGIRIKVKSEEKEME